MTSPCGLWGSRPILGDVARELVGVGRAEILDLAASARSGRSPGSARIGVRIARGSGLSVAQGGLQASGGRRALRGPGRAPGDSSGPWRPSPDGGDGAARAGPGGVEGATVARAASASSRR